MSIRYNNYHKHDMISNIFSPDSVTSVKNYIDRCVELGHTNYFTTNHGSFGDLFESLTLCKEAGLKCIAGIEGYIVPDATVHDKDIPNYHIVVIPKTNAARKKMNLLCSEANMSGFYYRPRLSVNTLASLEPDDVWITTACYAGLLYDQYGIENIFYPLYQRFGDNVLLEVQSHDSDKQRMINNRALSLHKELGLRIISANDSHYINEIDKERRTKFLKGKHFKYVDEDEFELDFPDAETILERYRIQGVLTEEQAEEALENTLLFDDCEEVALNKEIKMPTIYPNLTPEKRYEALEDEVWRRFYKISEDEEMTKTEIDERRDGIDYELKIIKDTNDVIHTADYFLFNEKLVDIAVNKHGGVLTRGGRGSCGSFYVNRILGMTQLDRFRIKLPIFPDRFASTARLLENRSLPDIDYNVKEQGPFVQAARDLLGENGCYPMIKYGTFQLKESFRNICRAEGLEPSDYDVISKDIDNYRDSKEWGALISEAEKYVDTIINGSVHPCAFLLLDKNILEEFGVVRLKDNLCVMMTSAEADEYKYLKDDFLIVSVWKLIDETFKEIGRPIIPANELLKEIKDDERIWNLFKDGITATLNQVDTDNGSAQAKRYGIKSFEDGAFIAAAIRPSFDSWREQFLSRKKYSTGSKALDDVLSMTNHYILFQENLMQYFEWLGVAPAESIGLIKKISKKKIKPEDFESLEERLKNNWMSKTGAEDGFDETWEMIQSCISYGFCSAHAAATSLDMCYGAYLKVNYPLQYYTVCFNNYDGDEEKTNKLRKELPYFGITLSNVRFRYSTAEYSYDVEKGVIYKGIGSIKFLSKKGARELYALRRKMYRDFLELLVDIDKNTSIDTRQRNILIEIGFFEEFGNINQLLRTAELYDSLYSRKILSLADIEKFGLSKDIVAKASGKVSEKQRFSEIDTRKLILLTLADEVIPEPTISEIVKYQCKNLGYVEFTDPKLSKRHIAVVDIDAKNTVRLKICNLYDGQMADIKMLKNTKNYRGELRKGFNSEGFEKGDILYMKRCERRPKMTKVGNDWVKSHTEKEWWLDDYKVINL